MFRINIINCNTFVYLCAIFAIFFLYSSSFHFFLNIYSNKEQNHGHFTFLYERGKLKVSFILNIVIKVAKNNKGKKREQSL